MLASFSTTVTLVYTELQRGAIELLRSKCGQNNNGLLEKEVHDAFYAIKVACSCSICQNLLT